MRKFVIFMLMMSFVLATSLPIVFAVDSTELLPGQDAGNRFLSAELTKQMTQQKTDIIQAVNDYNDENFGIFDTRLNQYLIDVKTKIMLAAAGASFISVGIASLIMIRYTKNYSYETYQKKLLDTSAVERQAKADVQKGFEQMQQPEWNPQQPNPTLGMVYGAAQAAQMTQMNSWQAQAPYGGGWQPPVETQPEFSRIPGGKFYADQYVPAEDNVQQDIPPANQPSNYQQGNFRVNTEDPMQSPGWDPRGGYSR